MIDKLIGNTPCIKIKYKYKNKIDYIYVKLEYYNLTGSIKDRIALYIIEKNIKNGKLKQGMPIVEATSGNTGIALSAIGAYYNHPVYIFMPNWVSEERIKIMEMYGAKVFLVSKEEGGFIEAVRRANKLASEINGFRFNQFNNMDNIDAHYFTTGKEIINDVSNIGAFVSGIGTGGTLMGVAKALKEKDNNIKIFAMEPQESPLISKGIKLSDHKIEGIGDDFIPNIVNLNYIDEIITISSNEAIAVAQKIAKELGIGVGISSGANLLAAILIKEKIKKNVVTIFVDDNKKYISTDLKKHITSSNMLKDISLISF